MYHSSQLYSLLFYLKEQYNIANHSAVFIKNSYMFRSQQTVNTTFQNDVKMQYIYIEQI